MGRVMQTQYQCLQQLLSEEDVGGVVCRWQQYA